MSYLMRQSRQRAKACRLLFIAMFAAGLGCLPSAILRAESPAVRGYITAVGPPDGFDVNGEHVTISAATHFGPIGSKSPAGNGPTHDAIQIGAWVEVYGGRDRKAKTVTAQTVLFRDDWDRNLNGLGVIAKVIATAPEPVFVADGYRIRVTLMTEVKFPRDVKSAADLRPGMWVLYEGKMGQDGQLIASKVRFLSTKHAKAKAEKATSDSNAPAASPQPPANGNQAAKEIASLPQDDSGDLNPPSEVSPPEIQIGDDTYDVSKDLAMQDRVLRIGWSLIPAYQKHLPANDPAKIRFWFIVINNGAREVLTSQDSNGQILVPAQLVARFKNDDQLATVLADGVASNMQQQAPIVIDMNRTTLEEAGILAAVSFIPYGSGAAAGGMWYQHQHDKEMNEQRWRVALELMAAAGYDPWQAPEAWRLAAPGELPADTSKLKYPDRSGYQFAILNRMYPHSSAAKPDPNEMKASTPTAK